MVRLEIRSKHLNILFAILKKKKHHSRKKPRYVSLPRDVGRYLTKFTRFQRATSTYLTPKQVTLLGTYYSLEHVFQEDNQQLTPIVTVLGTSALT